MTDNFNEKNGETDETVTDTAICYLSELAKRRSLTECVYAKYDEF